MTRRWSLAAAFLLTIVCGFLIVSLGSSSGVFAWADRGQGSGATQTLPGRSAAPPADATIGNPSIPVVNGAASPTVADSARGDDGQGQYRDGGERSSGGERESGGDID